MIFAIAIEMDCPGEIRTRLEQVNLFLEEQGVGAEIDKFLLGHDKRGDLIDVAVQQRLAAGENHDRGAALVDRVETLFGAQALIEDRVRVVDLAAAGTGEVAAKQRLQHQNQRVPRHTPEVSSEDISTYPNRLTQRNGQDALS